MEQNRIKDIHNQKELVRAAKSIKSYMIKEINEIPPKYRWLFEKLYKNIENGYRGLSVQKNLLDVLDEIIDENNLSSKLNWSKSPRKQKVEDIQRDYILKKHGIRILAGKKYGICASGENSFRFLYETYEFKQGIKKIEGITTKSMDGLIDKKSLSANSNCWVFQKVNTDDGGSTNSVEEEVIKTISVSNRHSVKFKDSDYFIFLLDGPYWLRKQYKNDLKTRFEKISDLASEKIIVCDSDTIKFELMKRKII